MRIRSLPPVTLILSEAVLVRDLERAQALVRLGDKWSSDPKNEPDLVSGVRVPGCVAVMCGVSPRPRGPGPKLRFGFRR